MSDIALALAEDTIEDSGQKYRIVPPAYGTCMNYQTYLEKETVKGVVRNKEAYGREYDDQMRRMGRDIGMGTYEWGKEEWKRSLDCSEHLMQLCFMVFRQTNGVVSFADFRKLWNTDCKIVDPSDGVEKDGCKGDEMWIKISAFINRPNGLRLDRMTVPGVS